MLDLGQYIQNIISMVTNVKLRAVRKQWTKDLEFSDWVLIDEENNPIKFDLVEMMYLNKPFP